MTLFLSSSPRLLSCYPKPNESFTSFLQRVSALHNLPSPKGLARLFSNQRTTIKKPWDIDLQAFAEALRLELSDISVLFPMPHRASSGARLFSIDGTCVGKEYFLARSRQRVCPECLLTNGYSFACWEMGLMTACPVHRVSLIDECTKCRSPLLWYRKQWLYCKCGQYLPSMKAPRSHKCELDISSLIWRAIGMPTLLTSPSYLPTSVWNWLQSLSLEALFKTLWLFGQYLGFPEVCSLGHTQVLKSVVGSRKVLVRARKVLDSWPQGFMKELNVRAKQALPKRKNRDMPGPFRAIHRFINEDMQGEEFRTISMVYQDEIIRILDRQPVRKGSPRLAERQLRLEF